MAKDVVIRIDGRLGNNLFRLATAIQYHKDHGKGGLYLCQGDRGWWRYFLTYKRFHILEPWPKPDLPGIVIGEKNPGEYSPLPDFDEDVLLDGNFESEKYFPDKDLIDNALHIPERLMRDIIVGIPDIRECVGISVRRGDYLQNGNDRLFYTPKIEWYTDMYHKYFEGKPAFVFSDDIEWCMEHMEQNPNFRFYVQQREKDDPYMITDPVRNIYTMALCHHHICSDSTWAWWGARLCEREDAVNIFQDKRFKNGRVAEEDYIPERWIKEQAEYE